jgi:hypothetical protein
MNDAYEIGQKVNPYLSPQHTAALAYIERGVPVFPCVAGGKRPRPNMGISRGKLWG